MCNINIIRSNFFRIRRIWWPICIVKARLDVWDNSIWFVNWVHRIEQICYSNHMIKSVMYVLGKKAYSWRTMFNVIIFLIKIWRWNMMSLCGIPSTVSTCWKRLFFNNSNNMLITACTVYYSMPVQDLHTLETFPWQGIKMALSSPHLLETWHYN